MQDMQKESQSKQDPAREDNILQLQQGRSLNSSLNLVQYRVNPRREEIALDRCNHMQMAVEEGKLSSTNIGQKFHLPPPQDGLLINSETAK